MPTSIVRNISLRHLTEEDIEPIVHYWHKYGEEHSLRGVDESRLGTITETRKVLFDHLNKRVLEGRCQYLIIRVNDLSVGHFFLAPEKISGEAQLHVHVTDPLYRGSGVVMEVADRAIRYFTEKFNIKKFIFETDVRNDPVNRMLNKFNFEVTGPFDREPQGILGSRRVFRREFHPTNSLNP